MSATRAGATSCPWCAVLSRARHYDWCPCSSASRRAVRAAYKISDEEGMRVADKISAFAQREANARELAAEAGTGEAA